MTSIDSKKKNRLLLLSTSLLLFASLVGCGDKNTDDKSNVSKANTKTSAPVIEIVQNRDAKKIKVKSTTTDGTKSEQQKSFYYDYGEKSEYNQNAEPANKDASVRVRPRTVIEANMNVRSPYEKVQISLLTQTLSKKFRVKCSACHDDYANGIIGPSLLDETADDIYQKISDFKSGKKSNPLMTDLINMMSDKEIKELANEIYAFNKKIKEMRKK